jgi:hypothetical protein
MHLIAVAVDPSAHLLPRARRFTLAGDPAGLSVIAAASRRLQGIGVLQDGGDVHVDTSHHRSPSDDLGLHRLRRAAVAVVPAATTALVALLLAEVLCHLRLEGGLQHGARDLAEQPTRPD